MLVFVLYLTFNLLLFLHHTKSHTEPIFNLYVQRTIIQFILNFYKNALHRSIMSDEEIDDVTREALLTLPNFGEKLLRGYFISKGYKVQRRKLRDSIRRVDPVGLNERRELISRRIHRRIYSVPHPHYLWHLDGNHKLIRWGFVIHAAIDGFTRCCIYLKCNDNNKSETVLQLFQNAINEANVFPNKIRTDYGTENVLVWETMANMRTAESGATVLLGSSVHNQRVERFNGEINRNIRQKFTAIFYSLENEGLLDIEDEYDKFALHYVFNSRINKALAELANSHNNHCIRTESNRTPNQLLALNGHTIMHLDSNDDICSSMRGGLLPDVYFDHLVDNVPPLTTDEDHGRTVYKAVREYVHLYAY